MGYVMSEYERQKRDFRRTQRKDAVKRLFKLLGLLSLFLVLFAVFGAMHYASFERELADARAKLEIARPKVPGIEADRALLKNRLEVVGYDRTKLAEVDRMRSYKRLLEDPQFRELDEKYLGAFSVAQNPGTLDQLARMIRLDDDRRELKVRDSMLAKTLAGSSANSPSRKADVVRVADALREIEEKYAGARSVREQAMAAVVRKVGAVGAAITARLDEVAELERKLEEGRELRRIFLSRLPFVKKASE